MMRKTCDACMPCFAPARVVTNEYYLAFGQGVKLDPPFRGKPSAAGGDGNKAFLLLETLESESLGPRPQRE
jgi:hypothetical protein